MVVVSALVAVADAAVGVLVQAAVDRTLGHLEKGRVKTEVGEAIDRALTTLFREMPELERLEAATEFGPALRLMCEQLVGSAVQPDVVALGQSLCHGAPTDRDAREVGTRLFRLLHKELYKVQAIRSRLSEWTVFQMWEANLPFGTPPKPEALGAEQRAVVERAAAEKAPTLLEWPQVLPNGDWLDRPELGDLLTRIQTEPQSATLLLGGPGLGKSALLARLGQCLRNTDDPPALFAIKADQIGPEVDTAGKLGEYLGLDGDPAEILLRLAQDRKVVLLVDQMDAVADIVDLTSRRLTLLLDLIVALDKADNVHVVASSRAFEYRHDPRFGRIAPKTMDLQPPSWEVVRPILEQAGARPDAWPEDRREEMRRPHALAAFLTLAKDLGDGGKVAPTYHGMLSQLWESRLGDPSVRTAVADLAAAMLDRESLSEALDAWEAQRPQLDEAVRAGILIRSADGLRVSFRHQTLFDHAVARAFKLKACPVADYALEHQESLFPRPRIWSILGYLRDLDRRQYEQGLEGLWATPDLRLHLRYLLLDFLGAQDAPTAVEQRVLLRAIDDDDFVMWASKAVSGSKGWFDVLLAGRLRELMRGSDQRRSAARLLLSRGLPFAQAEVLNLISVLWRTPKDWPLLVGVLYQVSDWTPAALALAEGAADNDAIGDHAIQNLAERIAVQRPSEAVNLVNRRLARVAQRVLSQDDPEKLGELFSEYDWYNLQDVAEAAPLDFLNEGLPWFVPAMKAYTWWPASEDAYAESRIYGAFDESGGKLHSAPLVSAFTAALLKLAEEDNADLEPVVTSLGSVEVDLVQRMLSRAMEVVARSRPERALAFLQEDARRFKLGSDQAPHLETRRLLRVVASGGSAAVQSACEALRRYQPPPSGEYWTETPEQRRNWEMRVRRRRLLLLLELPVDLLSEEQRRWRGEEARACPAVVPERDVDGHSIAHRFAPSMSSEAMVCATDDQIIEYLMKQHKAGLEERPVRRNRFSDEFCNFAQQRPARTMAIIGRLPVEGFEHALAGVLHQLAEASDAETFFDFVREQRARGHLGGRLIRDLALSSSRYAKAPDGLPEDMLTLFENELRDAPAPPAGDLQASRRAQQGQKERVRAILWRGGGSAMVPGGVYPLLRAVWQGRLFREPCEADAALTVALERLRHMVDEPKVWEHFMLFDLRNLRFCSPDLIVAFIDTLFDRMPSLAGTEAMTRLLAYAWKFVSLDDYLRWAKLIRATDWPEAKQAYGELISLRHLALPEDEAARRPLDALLTEDDPPCNRGVAFAAANLWTDILRRDVAADLMVRIAATGDAGVDAALIDAFRIAKPIPNDGATRRVLRAMVDGGVFDRAGASRFLLRALADLVVSLPDEVAAAADAIVRHAGRESGRMRTRDVHELIRVAVGLQSLGGAWRPKGLDLFEALLKVEAYEVESALADLDGPRRRRG